MIWRYRKLNEDENACVYAYARESNVLDGVLSVDKITGEAVIITPCVKDVGSTFSMDKACEHAYALFTGGFPEEEYIACG